MPQDWKGELAKFLRSPVVAAVAVAGGLLRIFWVVYMQRPPHVKLDFSTFYIGAWAIRNHINPYQTDLTPYADNFHLELGPVRRSNYPPTFFLMMEPLSYLNPWTAYWTWSLLTLALLLASLYLLLGAKKGMPLPTMLIMMSLGLMFRGIQQHFEFMQVQILLLFLLLLIWRGLASNNNLIAGALLAFAGLLKGYPLFMALYLVCTRRWRALGFTVLALIVGFGLTVAVMGSEAYWFFDTVSAHLSPGQGIRFTPTIGMAGSLMRFSRHFVPDDSNQALQVARRIMELIAEVAVLSLTTIAIVRARTDPRRAEYAFGLCAVAMVLCDPNAWAHYMVFLLIPLCQIAVATQIGAAPEIAPTLAAIAYVLAEVSYRANFRFVGHFHLQTPSWFAEGMFIATLLVFAAAYALTTRAAKANHTHLATAPTGWPRIS